MVVLEVVMVPTRATVAADSMAVAEVADLTTQATPGHHKVATVL
jgi:hypothetical protein